MTPGVRFMKRLLDVAGATAGIAMTWPLAIPIAIAIRLDSPGPIIFKQVRSGPLLDDEPTPAGHKWTSFHIYKFRTMRVDAEKGTGAVLATKGDPRVTRVGGFLRKTRLDELPQFLNVLKGDMSLVGPRPERPELLEALAQAIPYFEERTRGVKPGLTGLAQVSLGYSGNADPDSEAGKVFASLANPFGIEEAEGAVADDMRNKLMFDLAYAASLEDFWSYVRMELHILVKTPLIMVLSRGH
ncbi:MAG: sugar transferase [Labilithrix sp.]|nr:sugar transferase [Labilithrix sp.]MCW5811259.1 sugar transferase [Labilithrix sp.]